MRIESEMKVSSNTIGITLLGEKRMSVLVGKSANDPPLNIMFPESVISNGRLATIPDIVDVLLHNKSQNTALPPYITTMSAEYAGLSRTGIPSFQKEFWRLCDGDYGLDFQAILRELCVIQLRTGFWKPGFGVRFVQVHGDGPLTEIMPGLNDSF